MITHSVRKTFKASLLTLGLLGLGFSTASQAVMIDFESTALGTYSSLSYGGATVTYTGGSGTFDVVSASPGAPISGHALISYFQNAGASPFKVAFSGGTSFFKIGVGDYDADEDNDYLQAYSASNVLLDADYYYNPSWMYGGGYLSVSSSTPIAYVLFWDGEPYPGAVYWDEMSFSETRNLPEPSGIALFGLSLLGLAAIRKMSNS